MTMTICSTTGLAEKRPAAELARATYEDLEKLRAGMDKLAGVAALAGCQDLEMFAYETEARLDMVIARLQTLMPEEVWTGP